MKKHTDRIVKLASILLMPAMSFTAIAAEWDFPAGGDPRLVVPHDPGLSFPDGFKATVRLSVDPAGIDERKGFASVFCKGDDFQDGYCLMVSKKGEVLIVLKGIAPGYYLTSQFLSAGREYLLEMYVTKKVVRLFIDGKESGSYPYAGKFDFSNKHSLKIGTAGGYRFSGSIASLRLEDISAVEVPPGGPKPMLTELPMHQARAEILWSRVICKEEDRYIGWPTAIRLANGDILVAFSGDREAHACPWGKIQTLRSRDGGETWSGPETVWNSPVDDRDCGLVQLPDGDVLLTWFSSTAYRTESFLKRKWDKSDSRYWWRRHDEKISPDVRAASVGHYRMISKDNGHTWSKPEKMKDLAITPHGPVVLRDGSLFQLGRNTRKARLKDGRTYSKTIISAWRSEDKGASWQCLCREIADMNGENGKSHMFHEPHAIELPDGTILGLVRYHGPDNCMRQTVSRDGGRTWTPMKKTDMVGLPPYLTRLPDGKLVNVYGRRVPNGGFGEFATISDDDGRTWDTANEICLRPCHNDDLGYPSSCVLPTGEILTVYYQPEKPGEKPCLMATKWRITK